MGHPRNWGRGYSHITVSVNAKPFCVSHLRKQFCDDVSGAKGLGAEIFSAKT